MKRTSATDDADREAMHAMPVVIMIDIAILMIVCVIGTAVLWMVW